jgi:serine protease Do
MIRKLVLLVTMLVAVAVAAGVAVSPNGCSHRQQAGEEDSVAAVVSGAVSLTPQPAFARAAQRRGVTIADVAERSLASVVNISSTRVIRDRSGPHGSPFFNDPFFRHFFGRRFFGTPHPRERRARSLGSGVIVTRDGTVLTNNHVVEHAEKIRVTLADKRELEAEVVGTDPKSDLAVLKLKGEPGSLSPIAFGDSSRLRLGEVVIAIGNPFGVGQTVTMGIVSATGRANMGIVDYEDFIQTDAAINPGNSGGALINMAGELVGINTAILSRTGGYQGIGFAIPSNMARPIMDSLTRDGKVVRGWLGVAIQDLDPDLARALGTKQERGVLVADVREGSPADKAGLERGDVVLSFNGRKVDSTARLRNQTAAAGKGARVKLGILRDGARKTLEVTLGEMPAHRGGVARLDRSRGVLGGMTVQGLDRATRSKLGVPERVTHGVVVKEISRRSPAARAGLRPGDVILELDREAIRSVGQFTRLYDRAEGKVLLLIFRSGSTMYLLVTK